MSSLTRYAILELPSFADSPRNLPSGGYRGMPSEPATPSGRRGRADVPFAQPAGRRVKPSVVVQELSKKDEADILRNTRVVGAPAMPLKLIAPMKSASRDRAANPRGGARGKSNTWGIEAIGAHNSPFDGTGVAVAVLDTGIDREHPAFADRQLELEVKDFTGTGAGDSGGHGTHCAATIFGRDVNGKRIGVARGVNRAYIGKVLTEEGGSSETLFMAIQWALNQGARVISMSLGFDYPGMVNQLIQQGVPADVAASRGLFAFQANLRMFDRTMDVIRGTKGFWDAIVVAASGNESRANARPPYRLNASLPASAVDVISVGALAREADRFSVAPFSNTMPIICGPGVDIESAAHETGGLTTMSGTSMACPHVAGAAALWWQKVQHERGMASAQLVSAGLLASARSDVFVTGVVPEERGSGLVMCPPAEQQATAPRTRARPAVINVVAKKRRNDKK